MESLKKINDIVCKNEEKLDEINNKVSKVSEKMSNIELVFVKSFSNVAFIIISMSVFLGTGVFLPSNFDKSLLYVVPICYLLSEFFMYCIRKQELYQATLNNYNFNNKALKLLEIIISVLITISIFWIIILSTNIYIRNSVYTTLVLVFGNIVSIVLKQAKFEHILRF